WNTKPTWAARQRERSPLERRSIRRPSTATVPAVGVSSAPIRFSSVVLPEPDGPMSATKSPRGMSRSMPCRTSIVSPPRRYVLVSPRISTRTFTRLLVGDAYRGAVLERRRRRDDHALARAQSLQDLALGADGLSRRDGAARDSAVGVHEDRSVAAHRVRGNEGAGRDGRAGRRG